jgi:hypothetical protein
MELIGHWAGFRTIRRGGIISVNFMGLQELLRG